MEGGREREGGRKRGGRDEISSTVYAGQQVRILGENYSLEDEEDSKIGQVRHVPISFGGSLLGVWSFNVSNPLGHVWNVYYVRVPGHIRLKLESTTYLPFPGNNAYHSSLSYNFHVMYKSENNAYHSSLSYNFHVMYKSDFKSSECEVT